MNEEIVVEDGQSGSIEVQPADDHSTHVMPLLYIQQNKLGTGQSPTTNQPLLASNQSQLAAIINPISTPQLVANQNKVFIQSSSPVNLPQNKQHIVIRHPIGNVNTAPQNQGQKHILLRKPNTPNAQILPLNSAGTGAATQSSSGKHTFAYLGTFIKPNKTRESVVIPAGGIPAPQMQKPKLVITPMISGIGQTSTCTTPVSQSQPQKHMANLILPVSIPQSTGASKQSTLNLHFSHGQISDSKGTFAVLRESKATNATPYPPPLHPITKMSLLNVNKNTSNSPDSIKITENPDSAVITPIPKKDDTMQPSEKRKKTISNILRGSTEKRPKKQTFPKNQDSMDISYSVSSPEVDQDGGKKLNDDEITLIKVVQGEDKIRRKSLVDDDVKIEVVKTSTSSGGTSGGDKERKNEKTNGSNCEDIKDIINGNHSDPNFDAAKALDWKDGVGSLPGSSLKFLINEFGMMEVVDEDENSKQDKHSNGDKENVFLSRNSSKSVAVTATNDKKNEDKKSRQSVSADTLYCCESCGCYGMAAEFESPISCSPACTEMIAVKKQLRIKKEKEAKELRAKRKRKKMLMQEQNLKEGLEKVSEVEIDETDKEKDIEREKEKEKEKSRAKEKISKEERMKYESDEESRDTSTTNVDEESQNEKIESKYPWQTGKHGFSWSKYLEHCKAKAAPVKLFKDPFPYGKNLFKVGMKLEGIDPEHPSRYCILTVFEVVGYRIRLHFDGYPENFDFWVNADSMDIFPVGWAEKNGHKLDPPKGYVPTNFSWNAYLKTCKATPAPKTAFSSKSAVFPPTSFRVGMKLEAVDRKHSSLVCVASIAGLMDSRILVHFDSWDEVYDYWADASSPYIHPVGWCHHNGHSLTPPNNYKDAKTFTWDAYLRETRSVAAPARAFKQRPPCGFKRGMKFEAVDKRVPQLIRVATIEDVKDHMIKIRFDGWPEAHAYWVDDDSPDIHPVGWSNKTGHPLEAALTSEIIAEKTECGTPGCRGIGHIKGPKFATHNSASGCPYSSQNLHKIRLNTDRLNVKHEICDYDEDSLDRSKGDLWRVRDRSDKYSHEQKHIKSEKDVKQEYDEFDEVESKSSKMKQQHQSDGNTDEEDHTSRKRRKRRHISEEPLCPPSSGFGESLTTYAPNMPDKQLRNELYQSVYDPGYSPLPDAPHIWAKHSNVLNRVVAKQNTNPRRWSNEEVIKFIQSVPNCKEVGSIFRKHSIDGEAFLMLTQEDLVSLLGLRLGPAIKLYNSIVLLRRRAT
ncbi:lethal(3)malignant brain tumor-like protein 3 isoform X2 [Fopius arisanus]|uniref:Lethal(3)malignant brain tumor-like protein 3 isoform X2 n=1 Tax=Fopius arisanus TaxID=64838 RepID=A0A9R1T9A0_9HYME|nr:PREDICTED: lethal(3)malignant brain tumor-like protein 3 isoform X2 [Fopius arisanus]